MTVTLDPADSAAAQSLGRDAGENYRNLRHASKQINRKLTRALTKPLNAIASARAVSMLGLPPRTNLREEQIAPLRPVLMPYLQALADIASIEVRIALAYRRAALSLGVGRPRGTAIPELLDPEFRARLAESMERDPDPREFMLDYLQRRKLAQRLSAAVTSKIQTVAAESAKSIELSSGNVAARAERPSESALRRPRPVRPGPPSAQPFGVSHYGAEHWCAEWLRHLGATHVRVTPQSGDGGIDITADGWVVQVKNYQGSVGAPAVRELVGAAVVRKASAALLTSGKFTVEAQNYAAQAHVALLVYDVVLGTLRGVNSDGKRLRTRGF